MTTDELIDYYVELLIIQYVNLAKARATVRAFVKMMVMDQLPLLVQQAYDLDTAVGVQLDVLGKYAGVSRNAHTFTGPIVLTDPDYRLLIKMKIVQNNSGSDLSSIQDLLADFLPNVFQVFDYGNMHMSYYFNASYGSADLAEVFVRQNLLPKPMGVRLGTLVYSANLTNIFGFRTFDRQPPGISGFNLFDDYHEDRPWLNFSNAVVLG